MLPIILLFIASAFGQRQVDQGQVSLIRGAQTDADVVFGGCSGLGIDLNENGVFWAVSDDSRSGRPKVTDENPRFFDGSILFGANGREFAMNVRPMTVIPIPQAKEGEALFPEGFHYCGQYLYMGNGASDVRRFEPRLPNAEGGDSENVVPEVEGPLYLTPEYYAAGDNIEGVTKDQGNSMVYAVTGRAISRFQSLDNNPVSILEWRAEAENGERVLEREFLMKQEAGERTLDMVWESDRRFLYLVAVGEDQGEEPASFKEGSSTGRAARPSAIRLYSCLLPASGQSVMGMEAGQVREEMYVKRQLMAEFSIAQGPNGGDQLILSQDGAAVPGASVEFARVEEEEGPILPYFDGMAFGPDVPQEGQNPPRVRSLFLISDNNFSPNVPTRYVSLSYMPPQ